MTLSSPNSSYSYDREEEAVSVTLNENFPSPAQHERKKNSLLKRIGLLLLIVAIIAYSIAAFVYDFQSARAIFICEIVVLTCLLLHFLTNFFSETIQTCRINLETFISNCLQIRWVFWLASGISTMAAIAVVLYFTWDEPERLTSVLGVFFFTGWSYFLSYKRRQIKWRPVLTGFLLQFLLAMVILRTDWGFAAFEFLGEQITYLMQYTKVGTRFVFGYIGDDFAVMGGAPENAAIVTTVNASTMAPVDVIAAEGNLQGLYGSMAFAILPAIIFFSAFFAVLFYIGFMNVIIPPVGSAIAYVMDTSILESVVTIGGIFLGLEAPFIVKPLLPNMTQSELHAVMAAGFATISADVMPVFISFGVKPSDLLAASVMSAPAALAMSKIIYPETEKSPSKNIKHIKLENSGDSNVINAAANGASQGAVIVMECAGMLIAFVSLIDLLDKWVLYLGLRVGYADASFTSICGYLFYPLAWLMGVRGDDCLKVGELIAIKTILNEFVAYEKFFGIKDTLASRSKTIATYALCGYSNFGSMAITIAALGNLAPTRRKDISRLVFSAMITGAIGCFMTACIAGILYDSKRN